MFMGTLSILQTQFSVFLFVMVKRQQRSFLMGKRKAVPELNSDVWGFFPLFHPPRPPSKLCLFEIMSTYFRLCSQEMRILISTRVNTCCLLK